MVPTTSRLHSLGGLHRNGGHPQAVPKVALHALHPPISSAGCSTSSGALPFANSDKPPLDFKPTLLVSKGSASAVPESLWLPQADIVQHVELAVDEVTSSMPAPGSAQPLNGTAGMEDTAAAQGANSQLHTPHVNSTAVPSNPDVQLPSAGRDTLLDQQQSQPQQAATRVVPLSQQDVPAQPSRIVVPVTPSRPSLTSLISDPISDMFSPDSLHSNGSSTAASSRPGRRRKHASHAHTSPGAAQGGAAMSSDAASALPGSWSSIAEPLLPGSVAISNLAAGAPSQPGSAQPHIVLWPPGTDHVQVGHTGPADSQAVVSSHHQVQAGPSPLQASQQQPVVSDHDTTHTAQTDAPPGSSKVQYLQLRVNSEQLRSAARTHHRMMSSKHKQQGAQQQQQQGGQQHKGKEGEQQQQQQHTAGVQRQPHRQQQQQQYQQQQQQEVGGPDVGKSHSQSTRSLDPHQPSRHDSRDSPTRGSREASLSPDRRSTSPRAPRAWHRPGSAFKSRLKQLYSQQPHRALAAMIELADEQASSSASSSSGGGGGRRRAGSHDRVSSSPGSSTPAVIEQQQGQEEELQQGQQQWWQSYVYTFTDYATLSFDLKSTRKSQHLTPQEVELLTQLSDRLLRVQPPVTDNLPLPHNSLHHLDHNHNNSSSSDARVAKQARAGQQAGVQGGKGIHDLSTTRDGADGQRLSCNIKLNAFQHMSAADLAQLLLACQRLGFMHTPLFTSCEQLLLSTCDQAQPRHLVTCLSSLMHLHWKPRKSPDGRFLAAEQQAQQRPVAAFDILKRVGEFITRQGRISSLSEPQVVQLLWCYAQVLCRPPGVVGALWDQFKWPRGQYFSGSQICQALDSFSKLTRSPIKSLPAAMVHQLSNNPGHLEPRNFMQLYSALAFWRVRILPFTDHYQPSNEHLWVDDPREAATRQRSAQHRGAGRPRQRQQQAQGSGGGGGGSSRSEGAGWARYGSLWVEMGVEAVPAEDMFVIESVLARAVFQQVQEDREKRKQLQAGHSSRTSSPAHGASSSNSSRNDLPRFTPSQLCQLLGVMTCVPDLKLQTATQSAIFHAVMPHLHTCSLSDIRDLSRAVGTVLDVTPRYTLWFLFKFHWTAVCPLPPATPSPEQQHHLDPVDKRRPPMGPSTASQAAPSHQQEHHQSHQRQPQQQVQEQQQRQPLQQVQEQQQVVHVPKAALVTCAYVLYRLWPAHWNTLPTRGKPSWKAGVLIMWWEQVVNTLILPSLMSSAPGTDQSSRTPGQQHPGAGGGSNSGDSNTAAAAAAAVTAPGRGAARQQPKAESGRKGSKAQGLVDGAGGEVEGVRQAGGWPASHLLLLLQCSARIQHRNTQLWSKVCDCLLPHVAHMPPAELTQLMQAVGMLGYHHPRLMAHVEHAAYSLLASPLTSTSTRAAVVYTAWALVRQGQPATRLLSRLTAALRPAPDAVYPRHLVMVCWAVACSLQQEGAGGGPNPYHSFLVRSGDEVGSAVPKGMVRAKHMLMMLWALSSTGVCSAPFLSACADALRQALAYHNPDQHDDQQRWARGEGSRHHGAGAGGADGGGADGGGGDGGGGGGGGGGHVVHQGAGVVTGAVTTPSDAQLTAEQPAGGVMPVQSVTTPPPPRAPITPPGVAHLLAPATLAQATADELLRPKTAWPAASETGASFLGQAGASAVKPVLAAKPVRPAPTPAPPIPAAVVPQVAADSTAAVSAAVNAADASEVRPPLPPAVVTEDKASSPGLVQPPELRAAWTMSRTRDAPLSDDWSGQRVSVAPPESWWLLVKQLRLLLDAQPNLASKVLESFQRLGWQLDPQVEVQLMDRVSQAAATAKADVQKA